MDVFNGYISRTPRIRLSIESSNVVIITSMQTSPTVFIIPNGWKVPENIEQILQDSGWSTERTGRKMKLLAWNDKTVIDLPQGRIRGCGVVERLSSSRRETRFCVTTKWIPDSGEPIGRIENMAINASLIRGRYFDAAQRIEITASILKLMEGEGCARLGRRESLVNEAIEILTAGKRVSLQSKRPLRKLLEKEGIYRGCPKNPNFAN